MEPLKPIPTPPGQWWQLVCQRALPFVAFSAALIATVILWRHQGVGRSFVAIGDGPRANILAPQPATVVEFLVQPYAEVRQGTPIAHVRSFDPRSSIDRARLEMDRARLLAIPSLAENRAVDLERIRLDLARIRSELAIARVRHDFAAREVERLEPLFRSKLVAENTFEISRATRDMNAAEVREKERLMEEVQTRLNELESAPPLPPPDLPPLLPDLDPDALAHDGPITTLTAPIDGVVGPWLRQPGEFVVEGEPLVVIHGARADRIVGYLRQPVSFDPTAGMAVRVTRRTPGRQRFDTTIRHVGTQFEIITNALALVRDGTLLDVGLPVVIDLPPNQPVRPGEIVDVIVNRSPNASPAPTTALATRTPAAATPPGTTPTHANP